MLLCKKYAFVKQTLISFYNFCPLSGIPLNDASWRSNQIEIDHVYTSHRASKHYKQYIEKYGHFVNSLINLRPLAKEVHSGSLLQLSKDIDSDKIDNYRELFYNEDEFLTLSEVLRGSKYQPLSMESIYPVYKLKKLVNEAFQEAQIEIPFWFDPSKYIK